MFRFIWAWLQAWLQALFGYVKLWLPEAHDSAWLGAAPAMEEEPVTVSLGPIGPLFQQLRSVIASLQGNSRRLRLKGVKAQIQILGQELEWLCIDLKGRSEAPADAITMCWMRQVRDLCYDTADYLDELMHFIDCSSGTRRSRTRAPTFGGNRLLVCKTFRISRKLTWPSLPKVKKLKRAPLIAKLSALVARIEDADETRKRFKLSPPTSSKPDYAQAAAVIPQIPPQLHIDKLSKLLALDGSEMEKNLKVVTIFGSAGVGKTTIARTLYHQHRGRFQHQAFIRVSRDPDMRRLLTDMLSQIKAPPPHAFSDVQGLIGHISKHLQGKRYLIIIDDLWTTSTWDIIIRALPDGDYCRIITTTQVEDVALACCSYQLKHIYEITPLNDDQSGKSDGSSERMKAALNLVYNNLPPRLKACLLYLNMYPEGYTLRKDELVKQWVAEDLISSVQGQDIEDTAGCYFDALISRGMIQSVETNHNGEVLSCTLHLMVLDLIRQTSMEANFVTIVNYFQTILGLPDKVRRLSVQLGGAKGANNIPENMRISQVRSLLFSGYFKCVPSILDYGLLQVLILHIWSDQDRIFYLTTIGELYRLRYLKIESNITVKLPGKIRRLRHLGTLQVDATLCAVPSDIVHLEKLLHLCLPSESILPHGVGRMTSLSTLGYFDLGSNSEDNVRCLDELKNLQDLQLTCSTGEPAENLEKNMQLLLGSVFQKLSMLQSVTLAPASGSCNGNTQPDYGAVSSMSISSDCFSSVSPAPAHHLQRLELSRHCCIFSRLPKWLGELTQLCILKIAVRDLSKEDIDILKGLPALSALSLHVASVFSEMIVIGKGGFSVLTYFKFTCIVPLLKFEADAMPNLQKLRLGFNATVVDKQGIIIEHLSGIKEISIIIGCVGVGAGSTWLEAVTNDARNPKVQWLGSIYVSDEGTHVVTQEEAQENYRIQDKVLGVNEIMDETYGVQDEGSEAGENSEYADRNDPRKQMVHGMMLQRMGQKVPASNKLRGRLEIYGLETVKSKEEALEANLAAKERLKELTLRFSHFLNKPCTAEVEAEVQPLPCFTVRNEEGYEIKQLRDLNNLRGKLEIYGLETVKSKEEALEANLAAKERLKELTLRFSHFLNKPCTAEVEAEVQPCTAEVQAEVLEGLRPPVGLEQLRIFCYSSSRYPDWMVGRLNGGPKDLQTLGFNYCRQLGPGPELEGFPHLRNLTLNFCSWDALPGNLEHLTSLETLEIRKCKNIRLLPTLPQSLKEFNLSSCNMELMKGCQTEGDPNWLKIKHIPKKRFDPDINSDFFEEDCYQFSDEDSSHASEADQ